MNSGKRSAPVLLIGANRHTPPDKSRTVRRMKRLHDKLVSLGIVVKFLAASKGSHPRAKVLQDWGDCIEEGIPGSVLRVTVQEEHEKYNLCFPRDAFQIFRTDAHVPGDSYHRGSNELLDKLEINSRTCSPLSEGGLSVTDGDLVVLSSRLLKLMSADDIGDFSRYLGYYCAVLPRPDSAPHPERWMMGDGAANKFKGHLDLDFNMISTPEGTRLILVNEVYYGVFKKEVDALIKILTEVLGETVLMHVIPKQEQTLLPVNFIALPESRVVIPSGCETTQGFLQEKLGEERVITLLADDEHFLYNDGGGLRCMSALIAFSEYPDRAPDPRITSITIDGVTMFIPHPSLHSHPSIRVGSVDVGLD